MLTTVKSRMRAPRYLVSPRVIGRSFPHHGSFLEARVVSQLVERDGERERELGGHLRAVRRRHEPDLEDRGREQDAVRAQARVQPVEAALLQLADFARPPRRATRTRPEPEHAAEEERNKRERRARADR